jgi:hypothetical protein
MLLAVGVALTAAACSGTEAASPTETDAAMDAMLSVGDESVPDSSVTVGEAASSEGGACHLLPTGMETCNAVPQQSATITSSCVADPLPTATGGVVEDGTYVLQSLTYYGHDCPPSPDIERITWVVCGTQWELVEDIVAPDGGIQIVRLDLTRTSQGSMLSSNITCRPGTSQPTMADPQSYSAMPGRYSVQIKGPNGTRVDTFTKL